MLTLSAPQQSLAEGQQLRLKTLSSLTQESAASCGVGSSKNSSSCDADDFVIVPAHFVGEVATRSQIQSPTKRLSTLICFALQGS